MKKLLTVLIFLAAWASASEVYFDSRFTLWKDATILIWALNGDSPINASEFCLSLRRNNTGIGDPKCRELGEWERDTIATRYGSWLSNNLEKGLQSSYLRARHPGMAAKIQALEDNIVLFIAPQGKNFQIAIFDETSQEPQAAGIVRANNDKIALSDDIASTFFDKRTKRRLTKEERLKQRTEPDDLYKEVPNLKIWAGMGIGYSQAHFPFTPDNWTKNHTRSRVRNYRITKDSVSLWNFIDDADPYLSIYAGLTWHGFIGVEFMYRYSNRDMKTDNSDTIYRELDHWEFGQHDIGLNVLFSMTYPVTPWLDITPLAFIGFQYTFYNEDIGLKSDVKKPSRAYQYRIKFEDVYKGALLGIGGQFVFKKHYGVDLRAGLSSRGRDLYEAPSPDAGAAPTTIGRTTIDCFVSLGFEYHWTI
ncbi:hypothetical protein [Fibrobacter sp.]|uniref:hypothetical protein n=1 Tax=Fibrobacter sp. TaxID=35828 RepID=UPI0025C66A27|nr:hypothetical protein [Fibrobacter sp.]MBR3070447.1 hypothetical protein [Fibrobacter sp.]